MDPMIKVQVLETTGGWTTTLAAALNGGDAPAIDLEALNQLRAIPFGQQVRVVISHDGDETEVLYRAWFAGNDDIVILETPSGTRSVRAQVGRLEGDDAIRVAHLNVDASRGTRFGGGAFSEVGTTSFGALNSAEAALLGRLYGIAARWAAE